MRADLVPATFAQQVSEYEPEPDIAGADWIRTLPSLVDECVERWGLEIDGPPRHGYVALVLPVRRDGEPAMLKISWPHPEAEHEHLALRAWDGHGAARLLAADPSRWAMLLERLDDSRTLATQPVERSCQVIGELLGRLAIPATPKFERLSAYVADLPEEFAEAREVLPRQLVDRAIALVGELTQDDAVDSRLVHIDLHDENVLAATREPWLAIDPKPLAGDPAFCVAPALWNRWGAAVSGGRAHHELRRRLEIICDAGGIDADRARAWTIVRLVDNASGGGTGPEGHDWATVAVTIIKAMLAP
ncbi:aminoglycoside phosphotransferase family protein [Herbihabitans rhizosphaerae]|uniref:aminoglycoside phosphotransferase family protein n=1 Tax=Herbihabitans rhizosphaerae TaxID=1872711 RepID=UPI00102B8565|nr:aminoglycoside phosphotransferase family protein [Herbihabitans rhizosphaerae]